MGICDLCGGPGGCRDLLVGYRDDGDGGGGGGGEDGGDEDGGDEDGGGEDGSGEGDGKDSKAGRGNKNGDGDGRDDMGGRGNRYDDSDNKSEKDMWLAGLVDCAEGLPFGVGLYGVEELLGRMVEDGEGGRRFEYWPDAEQLRAVFWEALVAEVPELAAGSELRERVEKARLLGLLLWYGIAFDDGALNRVVEEGRDSEELQKLELFLSNETASIDATDVDDGSLHQPRASTPQH